MKKNYILIAIVFGATSLNAQVGINTESPKSTLHVKESEEFKSTLPEGIITPQFSGNDLKAKDNLYTELQKGTIVYITEGLTETASDKTININNPGYYFFDGTVWQKMNIEPWKIQGTNKQASNNNENIYQEGKVAIGQKLTDRVADTSLEVNGAISTIKTTNINNQNFTNSKLISQEFNDGNESVFIDGNFGYVGEPFDFTSSVSNFRNSVEEVILSPKGFIDYKVTGLTGNRLVSLNEVRIYDKTNSNQKIIFENDYGINLSNSNYRVATGVGEYSTGLKMISDVNNSGEFSNQFILGSYNISNKNEIKLGTTEENVTFKFSRKDSDDMYREESYVFPSNNGNKNQVLVTNGGSDNAVNNVATLEWKNMGEIVEEVVLNKIKIKSPSNKCFEITVSDNGQLNTVEVICPQ